MTQYILDTGTHRFYSDRIYIDNAIKIGKLSMKGKNVIIATEKDNVVMLLNETHESVEELNEAVAEYEENGFKVYHAKKG